MKKNKIVDIVFISLISIPTVRLSKVAFDKMVEPVEF